jgi:hypothetical protein
MTKFKERIAHKELDEAHERIAELEADRKLLMARLQQSENDTRKAIALFDEMTEIARKAETHAADCKRLVTAAENDLDAERMKRREAEAEVEKMDKWRGMWMDQKTQKERAESHAADCKRLVTACEDDIDAERMKRREAEATVERLHVCGNCKWFRTEEYQYCGLLDIPRYMAYEHEYYISAPDKCDFTPSRWAERGTK